MKKLFFLSLIMFFTRSYCMEQSFKQRDLVINTGTTNVSVTKSASTDQPEITLELLKQNATRLKQEIKDLKFPEKFSLFEKLIEHRSQALKLFAKEQPRRFTILTLILSTILKPEVKRSDNNKKNKLLAPLLIKKLVIPKVLHKVTINAPVKALKLSPNKEILFTNSSYGSIQIWNVSNPTTAIPLITFNNNHSIDEDDTQRFGFKQKQDLVQFFALSNDSKTLFTSFTHHHIKIWNISDLLEPKLITTLNSRHWFHYPNQQIFLYSLADDNQKEIEALAVNSHDTVEIWNISNLKMPTCLKKINNSQDYDDLPVYSFAFSIDKKILFNGSILNSIRSWNASLKQQTNHIIFKRYENNNETIACITFLLVSSDGKTLFGSTKDGFIFIWNISQEHLELITTLQDQNNKKIEIPTTNEGDFIVCYSMGVTSLTLSRDNKILISGHENGTIKIWNVFNPNQPVLITEIVKSHTDRVNSLELSIDNKLLISGSEDKTFKIWDLETLNLSKSSYRNFNVSEVVFDYFFIKELLQYGEKQKKIRPNLPLHITTKYLKTMFEELPTELQQQLISENYVILNTASGFQEFIPDEAENWGKQEL